MSRRHRSRIAYGLLVVVLGLIAPASAHAEWVWTPHTGWVGPSGGVKDSPEAQLEHGKMLFEQRDYPKARVEFQKLLKKYKNSREAADAQYYIGRCQEEEGEYYAAFKAYRKTIHTYPSTSRFSEILGRMYQIGNHFLGGKKRKLLGTVAVVPARDKAIEIFKAVTEEGPFTEPGELSQYKLGLAHMALGEYEPAVDALEKLISRYPNSPLVDDARFQLTQASLRGTFKPGYDQHPTDQAIEELEAFVTEYSSSDLSPQALERLKVLRERRAQHEFEVGQFYEKQKKREAALSYYQRIVAEYQDTSWAAKAAGRLEVLERLAAK